MDILMLLILSFFAFHKTLCYVDWSEDMEPLKWYKNAQDTFEKAFLYKPNRNIAKNIILFLGDGMGVSTVTAGRIYKGQKEGRNGEETRTYMETLDDSAYSKTYNIDAQTADSAGTATAYLTGVKTRIGVIGLDGHAEYSNCKSSLGREVESIAQWAHRASKSVGIVTTTRITHATPSGAYAHTPDRNWETYDGKYFGKKEHDEGCRDIASQLIDSHTYFNVLFGGGRANFLPNNVNDYKNVTNIGRRIDKRHLINEWINKMKSNGKSHKFIWNVSDLNDLEEVDHVLGLFATSNMEYEMFRDARVEPSLVEMTEKAIRLLERNKNGYFLLVEGGKIDHAHHDSKAQLALDEFNVFDEAIGAALRLTKKEDTHITVTADHSHVFTLGGYSLRGNRIFGLNYNGYSNISDRENTTYTSLLYANGPGAPKETRRFNLTDEMVKDPNYIQESTVYLASETHGGEDVPIYSSGPMSFLLRGTVEQSYIAHAMAYSACIGPYDTYRCRLHRSHAHSKAAEKIKASAFLLTITLILRKKI